MIINYYVSCYRVATFNILFVNYITDWLFAIAKVIKTLFTYKKLLCKSIGGRMRFFFKNAGQERRLGIDKLQCTTQHVAAAIAVVDAEVGSTPGDSIVN